MNTMRFLMPVVLLILFAPRGVQGQSVIAVSNTANRTIHLVDQSTGLVFKTVGVHSEVSGLASDNGDQVFYYTDQTRLYSVPYNGGVSTSIGQFTGDTTTIFGLAFHEPSNTLYGCHNTGIYEIDFQNAQTTLIFNPPGTNLLSGIDVDKWTSQMYVTDDNGSGLDGPGVYELNLGNLNYFSVIAPYPSQLSDVDGVAVNNGLIYLVEDGDLAGDRIHEVDLSSGFVIRTFNTPFSEGSFNSAGAFATPDSINTPVSGVPVPELAILDATMLNYMRARDIGAAVLGVSKGGVIVYRRAFGWRDAERQNNLPSYTIMRLASVTKPVTAAAIMELVNDGQISLNDFVFNNGSNNGLLTYTPFGTASPLIYAITVRDLLQHEGGWDSGTTGDLTYMELQIASEMGISSPPGRDATVEWIMGQPLQYVPGTVNAYSNIGYLLLGLIVEEVSGQSHLDFLRDEVFEPMGVFGSQIQWSRTFEVDHDAREPWYNHNGYRSENVFYPTFHPDEFVYSPYGGWDQEARIGQGGIVASPVAILKLLDNYQVFGSNIGGPPLSGNWSHTGSYTGTNTLARQRSDDVNYVVLFNKRTTYGNSYAGEIANLLDDVISGISDWPDVDVTGSFVNQFVLPAGQLVFGGLEDIEESDDLDLVARRSNSDLQSRVFIQVSATARVRDPDIFEFRLESAVFARGLVNQSIDLFNYRSEEWEQVDARPASRFVDNVVSVEPDGDLIRFVDPRDGTVQARVRYESPSPRQQFSVNIDQMIFSIE